MPTRSTELPDCPGAYLLILYLARGRKMAVGSLGSVIFRRGWYLYAGSAKGAGGIRARCLRHLKCDKPLRWHIDYLTVQSPPREIWHTLEIDEAGIVSCLERDADLSRPVPGFGASDSKALSHLFYSSRQPDIARLIGGMKAFVPR